MEGFTFSFALSILFLSSFTLSLNSVITDKQTLISFKNSITSDPYAILSTNWSQNTSVCDWIGVSCGLKHGRVTALNLSSYDLAGTISPHLGNLSFLIYLDISSNSFTGILPFELSKLRRLKVMNGGVNSFTGEIPTWLSSLPQLEKLYLYNNTFFGTIPASLFNNSKLQILNLNHNQLSGFIPYGIFNVSSLREIRIKNNSLSGWLPSDMCNNMPNIKILSLSVNRLEGQIPSNIWKCRPLEILSLSFNNFNGNIPREIGRLEVLRELYLGYNHGFQGRIPTELGNLSRLEILSIDNASLIGDIPSSIFSMSSLTYLSLSDNSLSGSIPTFQNLPKLEKLYLDNNKLKGGIPSEIGNLSRLEILNIDNACLTGDIPSSIFNISFLTFLSLSDNNLSGSLPTFHNLLKLEKLYLDNNKLTGHIPLNIWKCKHLEILNLKNNNLSGTISRAIGNASMLRVLKLAYNHFTVKVFNLELQEALRSFDVEAAILSSIGHRNLVRVIGCCSNMEFKALILTYMPNGSLDKWLHYDTYDLDLIQRLKIALDVAAALEYLHHGHTFPVVHCDIKPSNVLLDQDMTAHVSDFGISKLFDGGEMVIQTQTMATIGYAAPEFGMEGKVSTNGDVFSFGILLLEMFTGKRPTDDMFGEERSIKEWVSEALDENTATELAAPALLSREDQHFSAKVKCMLSIFELAMKCLADTADERINMIEAATALHKIYTTIVAGTSTRRPRFAVSVRQ